MRFLGATGWSPPLAARSGASSLAGSQSRYDVIVIGSGFGGAMAAHAPVFAGARVLMVERGGWVDRGPHNWEPAGAMELTPFYSKETPVRVRQGRRSSTIGLYHCVGGQSVFSGAVALRFRERDFVPDGDIVRDSAAKWPFGYKELEPYYARAEQLLGVAGESGVDPTDPPRTNPYPRGPATLSHTSGVIERAARDLGMHPFRLPLAINYENRSTRQACRACTTCDAFACAVEAKNDIATAIIPDLMRAGMELCPRTVATRLVLEGDRIVAVECVDRDSRRAWRAHADVVILAAGVLATPHLLLASHLERVNPAGHAVGRYLMRHCNGLVYGFFRHPPNPAREFHKQIGIHDFYFGHRDIPAPRGKLGCIQQVMAPPIGLIQARVPALIGRVLSLGVDHVTGLLAIAEDTPQLGNGVTVDWDVRDAYELPLPVVRHDYTARDLLARRALLRQAKRVLRKAGARFFYVHGIETFSHAVGTVRMGVDPATSPLDELGRYRGVHNLWVTDGSVMPTSAAVNPSLTISAIALRAGEAIAQGRAA
jgi:choline dehydrogenase-like flavoprotein